MMIHKMNPSVDYNQWLKRMNTQLNEQTNQNSLESSKLLSQRIRKRFYKTLGTSVTNSTLPTLSLREHPLYRKSEVFRDFKKHIQYIYIWGLSVRSSGFCERIIRKLHIAPSTTRNSNKDNSNKIQLPVIFLIILLH